MYRFGQPIDPNIWVRASKNLEAQKGRKEDQQTNFYRTEWERFNRTSKDQPAGSYDRREIVSGIALNIYRDMKNSTPTKLSPELSEQLINTVQKEIENTTSANQFCGRLEQIIPLFTGATEELKLSDFPRLQQSFSLSAKQRFGEGKLAQFRLVYGDPKDIVILLVSTSHHFSKENNADVLPARPPKITFYLSVYDLRRLVNGDSSFITSLEIILLHELFHLVSELRLPPEARVLDDKIRGKEIDELQYRKLPLERSADIQALVSYSLSLNRQGKSVQEIYGILVKILKSDLCKKIPEHAPLLARRVIKIVLRYK